MIWYTNSSIMMVDVHLMAIEGNRLGFMKPKAISVKADTFKIQGNIFHERIHTHAFDVKSKNVLITHNHFEDLDEQAFFKIQEDIHNPG
jgi:hypothetical protein